MGIILNLKNFFKTKKVVKEARMSINRSTAEEQLVKAKLRNKAAHQFGGARDRDLRAIYIPVRSKYKGYMRENSRCSFNKNR